jgi:hypothetical protein
VKTKKCCICEEYLPSTTEFFHKRHTSEDGLRCDCKKCRKEKKLKNYQKDFKKCTLCNIEKPNTDEYFNVLNNGLRARNRSLCKECHAKTMRKNHLKRTYNLTEEDYNAMYTSQEGCCAICKNPYKLLVIDHCHNKNTVRELLCDSCNRGIGFLKENIITLQNAIKYLQKHNKNDKNKST